jgi:hypothetical protein
LKQKAGINHAPQWPRGISGQWNPPLVQPTSSRSRGSVFH